LPFFFFLPTGAPFGLLEKNVSRTMIFHFPIMGEYAGPARMTNYFPERIFGVLRFGSTKPQPATSVGVPFKFDNALTTRNAGGFLGVRMPSALPPDLFAREIESAPRSTWTFRNRGCGLKLLDFIFLRDRKLSPAAKGIQSMKVAIPGGQPWLAL